MAEAKRGTKKYECPGCGHEIEVPLFAYWQIKDADRGHIGCLNESEHDSGEPLVMWPQEGP